MHKALGRQYHKSMSQLLSELQEKNSPAERVAVGKRISNMLPQMYVVNSKACQEISEALAQLNRPQLPIVNASLRTIQDSLQKLHDSINIHPQEQFVAFGQERFFARPVREQELFGLLHHERLWDEQHSPYIYAFDAPPEVASVLFKTDVQTLKPVLERLGFPLADSLVFFKTRAQPSLGKPTENIPSLRIVKLRSGIPVQVIKRRAL